MKSNHVILANVFLILLLQLALRQVYAENQRRSVQKSELISGLIDDEVIALEEHSLAKKGKRTSRLVKNVHESSWRGSSVEESGPLQYEDDQNCGRVPMFEKLYAKSINESHYKLASQLRGDGGHRILYGTGAVPGEWPWVAKLEIFGENGVRDCTGSLLNDRWIVTAAHCVHDATRAEATLGLSDLLVRDQSALTIGCEKVVKHANATKTHNDVALLRLRKPVRFNEFIMPVCLASGGPLSSARQTEEKQFCHSIGFGLNENWDLPWKLQKLEIKMASCKRLVEDVEHELPDVICVLPLAVNIGGTCHGDSGGPNVCYNRAANRWNLVGITSFGPTDCNRHESDPDGWITGSMDVERYRHWLAHTIKKHA